MNQLKESKVYSVIENPRIKKIRVEKPYADTHIFNEDKFEVLQLSYSGGDMVVLIPKGLNNK